MKTLVEFINEADNSSYMKKVSKFCKNILGTDKPKFAAYGTKEYMKLRQAFEDVHGSNMFAKVSHEKQPFLYDRENFIAEHPETRAAIEASPISIQYGEMKAKHSDVNLTVMLELEPVVVLYNNEWIPIIAQNPRFKKEGYGEPDADELFGFYYVD